VGLLDSDRETELADMAPTLRVRALRSDSDLKPVDAADEPRQLIIDLGLPRNVDPDVATVPGVELLDLETIRIHAPLEELNATSDARSLVGKAARKFSAVAEEQSLAPAVVALRSHVFDILDAEIERAHARGDSSPETEAALRHLAGVLLHTPMVRSRELARAGEQQAYLDGLDALFGLTVKPAAVGATRSVPTSDRVLPGA
jgi:glutamyl-tRNA reductase